MFYNHTYCGELSERYKLIVATFNYMYNRGIDDKKNLNGNT